MKCIFSPLLLEGLEGSDNDQGPIAILSTGNPSDWRGEEKGHITTVLCPLTSVGKGN